MDHQGLRVADVRHVRQQLDRIDELPAGLQPALDAEADQPSVPFLQVFRRNGMAGIVRQSRIRHPVHQRMFLEPAGDFKGIFRMALLPQRQRLQPQQELVGVEGTERRADVAQQGHPHLQDKGHVPEPGHISERIPEHQPVIARIGLGELREFPVIPLEPARVHDHPADGGAVAADILRRGTGQDVDTVVERPDQPDADGVVRHHGDPVFMGDFRNRLEVRHVQLRVADRFHVDRPRPRRDRLAERLRIARVDEPDRPPQLGERVVEQLVGAAVEVVPRHDLVAQPRDRQQRERDGRLPRGDAQRGRSALDRGDALLEHVRRGVHQPRVDVTELLQREQVRGMLGALEHVGRGLVDRDRPRAGRRVGLLPRVQGQGVDSRCAHFRISYSFVF